MSSTQCLVAAELSVGMQYEQRFSFSREQVSTYCELCGDYNAIHHDVEAARLRFPDASDIIVPGGLIQIAITGIFGSSFPGDGSLGLTFTPDRFRKPVVPDQEILVRLEVIKIRADMVEVSIAILNPPDEQIGSARARLIAPDENYRTWWREHRAAPV